MSIAEKEHIWRISKKWVDDDIEEEEIEEREVSSMSSEAPPEPTEEMVPKRLYDKLLNEMENLKIQHKAELEQMVPKPWYDEQLEENENLK